MNDLIAVQKIAGWEKLKALVLDSVSSPITKRVYNMTLEEFMAWFQQEPRPGGFCTRHLSLSLRRSGGTSSLRVMQAGIRDNHFVPSMTSGFAFSSLATADLVVDAAYEGGSHSCRPRLFEFPRWLTPRRKWLRRNSPNVCSDLCRSWGAKLFLSERQPRSVGARFPPIGNRGVGIDPDVQVAGEKPSSD
jgi:hypothetical protein